MTLWTYTTLTGAAARHPALPSFLHLPVTVTRQGMLRYHGSLASRSPGAGYNAPTGRECDNSALTLAIPSPTVPAKSVTPNKRTPSNGPVLE